MDVEIYRCAFCGESFEVKYPTTSMPNTACGPHVDETGTFMVQMTRFVPADKEDK